MRHDHDDPKQSPSKTLRELADFALLTDEQAIQVEAEEAFPHLPPWKAMCEFALEEARGFLAQIARADACRPLALVVGQGPERREWRGRAS